MNRDLIVSVRLKADGSGLVGTARESAAAIAGIGTAAEGAAVQARALVTAIGEASRAAGIGSTGREASAALEATARSSTSAGGSARQAAAALGQLTDRSRAAASGADELAAAADRVTRAQARTASQAADAARATVELARAERDAAREAVAAAETRVGKARGRIELTPDNPTITLSPGGGGSAGNDRELATATAELAQARQRAQAAEAAYAQSLRDSTQASTAAHTATTALATQSQAGAADTGQLAQALERVSSEATATARATRAQADSAADASDATRQQASAAETLTDATDSQTAATGRQTQSRAQAGREATELAAAEARLAGATNETEREEAAAAIAAIKLAQAQREAARRTAEAEAETRRHAFGLRNAGQQVGDFGLQIASGANPITAFSQQIGQLGYAMSEMGGTAGKVGAFLTGPWGIGITVATAVLLPFVAELFKAEEAAEAAKLGADGLAEAQSVLGGMFDLTTGKLKKQNELLILNARLTAINLRGEAAQARASAREAFGNVDGISAEGRLRGALEGNGPAGHVAGAIVGSDRAQQNARNLRSVVSDLDAGRVTPEAVLRATEKLDFTGLKVSREEFQKAIIDRTSSTAKEQIADLIDKSLDDKQLAGALRREGRDKKPEKPKSTEARDEFGRDAAARVAGIMDQFDRTPPAVRQANAALRQLDDIMDDLERKKPPQFETTIAQAKEARLVVAEGLNRPIADFVEGQRQAFEVGQELLSGHHDQAEALRVIQQLERQRGPLNEEQKEAVLAATQALTAQERQLDRMLQRQRIYLAGIADIRGLLTATISGDSGLDKLPERILQSFARVSAEKLVDDWFGDMFQSLEDQATGTRVVEDASVRMADAVDIVTARTGQASTALETLTRAANGAAGAVQKGAPQPGAKAPADQPAGGSGDVTVTAPRRRTSSPQELFEGAIGGVATKITGLFTNDDTASKIGKSLGKFAGKGLAGAFEGQAASSFANLVGIKTNATGSAIGGAIGGLTGIPGAGAVLGVAGGIIGKLFEGVKSGRATIRSVDGSAELGGDEKIRDALSGTAKNVQSGIQRIADALGADVGSFNVSIGKREDYYRVDGSGSSRVDAKHPGSGLLYNGTDESAAIEIAIRDALADGAIQGVSPAVAKALQRPGTLDRAVAEAVKVTDLEKRLGGLTGQLKSVFDSFDRTAADRVRIAKAYGLDLLQVEKLNAEERSKLLEDTLKSRVGSLKDLLESLTSGDLFEGSAVDRRDALLKDIAAARADAEAGKDGAADRVAQLYRQLLATTKDSFGSGAELAADRNAADEAARSLIAVETNRVNSAAGVQAAQTAAIQTGNALTGQVVAATEETNALLRVLIAQGKDGSRSVEPDLSLLERDYR
ncbi:hypothetical protein [Sphingomonas sp. SORGH_AS_0879]|uniref:hypothetical protein n=1 Tax=Sphingomonas sp. SORGH_AS_0879 TaxID=3041790 RepID=UPI00277F0CAE|nr:hypothetical protein [Sphingomonas sp. SORGH_AS_0879]MDQ1229270.1 hypothetical protein [Sphingomonas sp. SORGH_AS_0879]